jgi:lipopolysaccharide export system protein LptA
MLRSTRGLLLLAIILMLGAVAATYYQQKRTLARQAPQAPSTLPSNTDASATGWEYRKDEASHCIFVVRAKHFSQLNDPLLVQLDGVEVLICKDEGRQYDRIRSAKALFDQNKGTLYSDGVVDIEMGVPAQGQPQGRILRIHSSGVTYDTKSGRASTDRAANFEFDQGNGKSVGASYDPNIREINMRSQVELNWRGRGPASRPMKIEAGELIYKERDSYVLLRPWSRLTRETGVLEGGEAVVTLKDGAIEKVEAQQAHGNDHQPGRTLEYSADRFMMGMTPEGEVQKIIGEPNAHLVSVTDTARTTVTSRRVDLDFNSDSGASELRQAMTWENTVLESAPVPRKDVLPAETRVVRSNRVLLKMRPGGRDIESVETLTRGQLEFLPNQPVQRHRTLDADHMFVTYGAANMIQTFRATNAATRTDPAPPAKNAPKPKTPPSPSYTWSKDLKADFDPKTGQLARMEQWNDFRYEEGERKARAHRATLEEARDLITLEQAARIWDTTGATSADRILLDQKSGDVNAEGNVISTRMPDHKDKSSAMLSNDQPMEAKAHKMVTTGRNQKIHYEGQAIAWQGANRIWGDTIDIDRTARRLTAHGNVRTQLVEQSKDEPEKKGGEPTAAVKPVAASTASTLPAKAPAFIMVTSSDLVYTEPDRLAHYTGGVHLVRPGMDVKSSELRAFLNDSDGQVAIVRSEPDRTLTGTSEHAEYYTAEERIFLNKGEPVLVDSLRGVTRGRELTYFTNEDKLLVNGATKEPVRTRLLRRR